MAKRLNIIITTLEFFPDHSSFILYSCFVRTKIVAFHDPILETDRKSSVATVTLDSRVVAKMPSVSVPKDCSIQERRLLRGTLEGAMLLFQLYVPEVTSEV